MTAAELIGKLRTFAPETRVVVQGYEDGFDDVAEVRAVTIKPDPNPDWYYGRHCAARKDERDAEPAVLLFSQRRSGE